MCLISSGFLCQSPVCKKLPANIYISGILALFAKFITFSESPSLIKALTALILSPS